MTVEDGCAAPQTDLSAHLADEPASAVPEEADGQRAAEGPYRVGRRVGRTIYRMAGDQPSDTDELIGVMDSPALAAFAVRGMNATPDRPRRWALPDEPGPEVRRLRPVERYPGDNSIWLDREPDNSGWRIVMRGRAGEPMEWVRAYSLGAGSAWGGRPLVDATPAADGQPAETGRGDA